MNVVNDNLNAVNGNLGPINGNLGDVKKQQNAVKISILLFFDKNSKLLFFLLSVLGFFAKTKQQNLLFISAGQFKSPFIQKLQFMTPLCFHYF